MNTRYFRRYYEAADDSGAALSEEPTVEPDETTEPEVAPEPETYTREQLAELLGPRFERFASHEGEEAFRQFGNAYDSATGLIRQGAHLEPQDASVYEQIGLDPSEVQLPEPDQGMGIFGAPWEPPNAWDQILELAQSEHAQHRQQAADVVVRMPDAPEDYKRAYWDNAYGQGSYDALSLQQQVMEERLAAREAEIEQRIMERFAPLQEAHTSTYVDGMLAQARASIPGLAEHEPGVAALMKDRESRYPGYKDRFDSWDVAAQVAELRELTLIAASRAEPQRVAAQQQASDANTTAKLRGRTETGRTAGSSDPEGEAALREERAQLARIGRLIT